MHEVLTSYGRAETQDQVPIEIHHHPDPNKPRSQYLPLLRMAVSEDPGNDRNAFYFARELYFYGMFEEAACEFERHLSLPTALWAPERAASMRYLARLRPDDREYWLTKAVEECPDRREALVEFAAVLVDRQDWSGALEYLERALAIEVKPLEYLCEEFAWGPLPHDLAALCLNNLGRNCEALEQAEVALSLAPDDERIEENVVILRLLSGSIVEEN